LSQRVLSECQLSNASEADVAGLGVKLEDALDLQGMEQTFDFMIAKP